MKNTPLTSFLFVMMTVIFSMYYTTLLKKIPCEKDLTSVLVSNFIHTKPTHFFYNMYAVYAMSRIETKMGFKKFAMLITFALIVNSIIETLAHKIYESPCSIGFSGVLYSVFTYDFMATNEVDLYMMTALIAKVFVGDKDSSIIGHLTGVVSGILFTVGG